MEINSEQEPVEKPVEKVHTGMKNNMLNVQQRDMKQNPHLIIDYSPSDSGHICCILGQTNEAYALNKKMFNCISIIWMSIQEMSGVEAGVDRIVDQIVNPAAMEAEVESVIYRFWLHFMLIFLLKFDNILILILKVLWYNQGGWGG